MLPRQRCSSHDHEQRDSFDGIFPWRQGKMLTDGTYHVMRCEPVARFDNEEHAAFLVELLKGQPHERNYF
jgi:hypothetical protein